MQIAFIRHGQPEREWNTDKVADPGLSELGKWQAERLADWLEHEPFDHIISSTKRRAIETIEPLATRLGLEIELEEDFTEIDRNSKVYLPTELLATEGGEYFEAIRGPGLCRNRLGYSRGVPQAGDGRLRAAVRGSAWAAHRGGLPRRSGQPGGVGAGDGLGADPPPGFLLRHLPGVDGRQPPGADEHERNRPLLRHPHRGHRLHARRGDQRAPVLAGRCQRTTRNLGSKVSGMSRFPKRFASSVFVPALLVLGLLGALLTACGGGDDSAPGVEQATASSVPAATTTASPTAVPTPTMAATPMPTPESGPEPAEQTPVVTPTVPPTTSTPEPDGVEPDDSPEEIQREQDRLRREELERQRLAKLEEERRQREAAAVLPPVPTPAASTVGELLALGRPLVIAHAGGDRSWPHSTMYAFSQAAYAGVDVLEMDLQMTADRVLVVHHDDTVDRTTNATGRVRT